jgi:DNA mismatch repair protein MutS
LDNTYTSGGARLLRHILSHPVHDMSVLTQRQQQIQYCLQHNDLYVMHQLLRQVHDIPKMVSTILYKQLTPVSFVKLRSTLAIFLDERHNPKLLREVIVLLQRIGLDETVLDGVRNLYNYLDQLIVDAEAMGNNDHFIRDGYSEDIDALKKVAFHSDDLLLTYQQELVQYT